MIISSEKYLCKTPPEKSRVHSPIFKISHLYSFVNSKFSYTFVPAHLRKRSRSAFRMQETDRNGVSAVSRYFGIRRRNGAPASPAREPASTVKSAPGSPVKAPAAAINFTSPHPRASRLKIFFPCDSAKCHQPPAASMETSDSKSAATRESRFQADGNSAANATPQIMPK